MLLPPNLRQRLGELAQRVAEISRRVRQAVTEAVTRTLTRAAHEVVDDCLDRPVCRRALPAYGPFPPEDYDPWSDEPPDDAWDGSDPRSTDADRLGPTGPCVPPPPPPPPAPPPCAG